MFIQKRTSAASLLAMVVVVCTMGCQNSGNQPQSSNPQSAASGARQIEVHTEDQPGHRSGDDQPNCFRRDDSRDVVVTVTAPEIQSEKNVAIRIWGVSKNKILFPQKTTIKPGSAEFRFNDERKALEEHLGPGPYVATADVTTINSARRPQIQHFTLSVVYDTYEESSDECRN
jgi:hypothetical protein